MKRILLAATALFLLAGCTVNSTFVYKPSAPVAEGRKLPVKLAVLPFADGTEEFMIRGGWFSPQSFNLAKAGIGGMITALTPEFWAKAFADEAAASGDFRAVRFVYSNSELTDEDYWIDGTVEKATDGGHWTSPNVFAIRLRAFPRSVGESVWEKVVTRTWQQWSPGLFAGCGEFGRQCRVDQFHAKINEVMLGMFAEARSDLVLTLEAISLGRGGTDSSWPVASSEPSPDTKSVEETIEAILNEK